MIILPFLSLIIILVFYYIRNNGYFGVVSLLILVYLFMAGSSLVLESSGFFESVFPITLEPMVYLSICFFIVFWGFWGYRDRRLIALKIECMYLYRVMEISLMIGGLLAILFFLPFAYVALTGDVLANRTDQVLSGSLLARYGLINSLFSFFANLFILNQVCFFVSLIHRGGKKSSCKTYLLLLSSFSYVIYIFAYVGRDGVVFWLMSFAFCFLLFKDFLEVNDLKKIKLNFALTLALLLIPFMAITIARFYDSIGGIGWQMLDYAGQQVRNFNDHYNVEAPLLGGAFDFPLFVTFLEFLSGYVPPEFDSADYFSYYLDEGVLPWVFTTFIGSLMIDFGKVGTVVFLIMMSFVTRAVLKKTKRTGVLDFSNLIIFVLLYQVPYWGVFYFKQYATNYYIVSMILIFITFKSMSFSRFSAFYYKIRTNKQPWLFRILVPRRYFLCITEDDSENV